MNELAMEYLSHHFVWLQMEHAHHAHEYRGTSPQSVSEWLDHIEDKIGNVDQHRTTNAQIGMPSHNKRERWQHQWREPPYSMTIDREHTERGHNTPNT